MHIWGPVITNIKDIYRLLQYKDTARRLHTPYTTIKVVTGWGMPWNDITRAQLLAATEYTIIRTTIGDPSNRNTGKYLLPDKVIAELAPWLQIKPDAMIELGNEPNIKDTDPWIYRWWLNESIKECRKAFPHAHIIAPALIHNDTYLQWLDIMRDVMVTADSIAMHVYEHYGFTGVLPARTNQLYDLDKAYTSYVSSKPIILTEFGINDPLTPKLTKHIRYSEFIKTLPSRYLGGTYYHINEAQDIDPQYHIPVL